MFENFGMGTLIYYCTNDLIIIIIFKLGVEKDEEY